MRRTITTLALAAAAGIAATANAGVTFSNVNITGTLAAGATWATGGAGDDIDFSFPSALVGDGQNLRSGVITITFIAKSDTALNLDKLGLSILGGLLGSGTIIFNEVVEDLVNPGIIATYGVTLNSASQLPHTADIHFSRESTMVKVKKTLILSAVDTQAFDLAGVALVEQKLVPTPGAAALLGMGVLAMGRRRRA
ncbi:MAG: hypothetical protein SFY96_13425 [Planctomycetota bacterium]|nr:hypothetical protein [Planctomycetota bacterium]